MTAQLIIAGLTLGVFSSFHCVGMCGPLVLSLPLDRNSPLRSQLTILLYHSGRILTYMVMGIVFSSLGRGIYIAGWQQRFSIILGVGMLLIATYSLLSKSFIQPRFITRLHQGVHHLMSYAIKSKNKAGIFLLGISNGLLPCGMVYLAIAGALTSTELWQGAAFMGCFGLGTLPALWLLSLLSFRVGLPLRNAMKKLMPAVIIVMGILLILRGMNLGIPFLSPMLPSAPGEAVPCH